MNQLLGEKLRTHFPAMTIYKDPSSINTLFAGRNLPRLSKISLSNDISMNEVKLIRVLLRLL